jgi:hypothetical protein
MSFEVNFFFAFVRNEIRQDKNEIKIMIICLMTRFVIVCLLPSSFVPRLLRQIKVDENPDIPHPPKQKNVSNVWKHAAVRR